LYHEENGEAVQLATFLLILQSIINCCKSIDYQVFSLMLGLLYLIL